MSEQSPKTASRLRVPVLSLRQGKIELDADSAHYVTRVHRLQVGQPLLGFDPEQGTVAQGSILAIAKGKVRCSFEAPTPAVVSRKYRLCLIQGIGKGDKPDRIVRAATELGATELCFVRMERSVVDVGGRVQSRLSRLKAIAIDAARQSGRGDLPELHHSDGLGPALERWQHAGAQLLLDQEAKAALAVALTQSNSSEVTLLIGPEGGLTPLEHELAILKGFLGCRMGDHVLRTETAAIAAMGAAVAHLVQSQRQAEAL